MLSLISKPYINLKINNSNTRFIVNRKNGYNVYSIDTLNLIYSNNFNKPIDLFNISMIEILNDTNLLSFIIKDDFSNNIIFWDDKRNKILGNLEIFTNIYNLILTKFYIIISTKKHILIYPLNNKISKSIYTIDTFENKGEISVIDKDGDIIIACCSLTKGIIHIKNINKNLDTYINIFDEALSSFEISKNGKYIAACDLNCYYIKIIDIDTKKIINTFVRGYIKKPTILYSLKFSNDNKYLILATMRKTIHIFKIDESYNNYFNYFIYPTSINKIYVSYDNFIITFNSNNELLVISDFGLIDKYEICENNNCKKLENYNLFTIKN